MALDGVEEQEEELTYEEVVEEQEVVDDTVDCLVSLVPPLSQSQPNQVEDTHQTYLNLFTHSDADDDDELRVEENEEEYDDV